MASTTPSAPRATGYNPCSVSGLPGRCAMRIVQELNFQLDLRLYHEVSVLKPEEQHFEYINCHPGTGLMNGL